MRGLRMIGALCALVLITTGFAGGGGDGDSPPEIVEESLDYEDTIELSVDDIEAFWADQLPEVFDVRYTTIENVYPYTSQTDPFPACGESGDTYEEMASNAFYCPGPDFIAYDDEDLFPRLYDTEGNIAVAGVLAHEWGHAIEDQLGLLDPPQYDTIVMETMADCFAGAWLRYVDEGGSELLELEPGDVDIALSSVLEIGDPVGLDPYTPGAHGSAFDRVGAFQDGFENGTERCGEYPDDPPEFESLVFTDVDDLATAGNLPLDEIIDLATQDLDAYWAETLTEYEPVSKVIPYDLDDRLPTCGDEEANPGAFNDVAFYCPIEDFVAWENELMEATYEDGDFAVATLIAGQWSSAVQSQLQIDGNALQVAKHKDCLTGSWAGDISEGLRGDDAYLLLTGRPRRGDAHAARLRQPQRHEVRGSGDQLRPRRRLPSGFPRRRRQLRELRAGEAAEEVEGERRGLRI